MPRTPAGMPRSSAKGRDREDLATWMKRHFERIEAENALRVEMLREAGEHPSPLFQGQVRRFAALGLPKAQIARLVGISVAMLMSHYDDDVEHGMAEANAAVAANMLRIATTGDPSAGNVGMRWLERRGGDSWKPPAQKLAVETTGQGPVIDSSKLTFEQREQLRQIILAATDEDNSGQGDEQEGQHGHDH